MEVVQRVEQTPYDYIPDRRPPRLGGGIISHFCNPSAAIAAAGAPPSGTIHTLASQTVYIISNGNWVTLSGTFTIVNPYTTATVITKLCSLVPNPDGTYSIYAQAC